MSKPQPFPDVTRPLKLMDLGLKLGALVPENTITIAIAVGLEEGRINEVISMVKNQIEHNPKMMLNILGEDLLTDIENF